MKPPELSHTTYISIHSTARVETSGLIEKVRFYKISIHSTARVETGQGRDGLAH